MHNVLSQIQRHAIRIWTARVPHFVVSRIATPPNTRKNEFNFLNFRTLHASHYVEDPQPLTNKNCKQADLFLDSRQWPGITLPVDLSRQRVISVVKDYQTSKCLPKFSLPLPMRNLCRYVRLFRIHP